MSNLDHLNYESAHFDFPGYDHPLAVQILIYPKPEKLICRIVEIEDGVARCAQALVWAEPGSQTRTFDLSVYVGEKDIPREWRVEAHSRDYDEFVRHVDELAADALRLNRHQKECFSEEDVSPVQFAQLCARVSDHVQSWSRSSMPEKLLPFG